MYRTKSLRAALVGGVCAMAMATATGAAAQSRDFSVPAGDLQAALDTYAQQAGVQLLYRVDLVKGVSSRGARGVLSSDQALEMVLADTGLKIRRHPSGAVAIVPESRDPQGASAAGSGAEVEALIVTAQKREEDIQDVPIAMSAFTQEDLTRSQIAGGPDLMTQVPNFTFTKTNFSSYSIQIRGIGTQAISATVDPAVAVAFNNTPFVTNRFFEQEFYDLNRVEVLRGPQGTLYGRNATAGVVNLISQKPKFFHEARLSADLANYSSHRLEGMINIPLVEDKVALRLAGAWTKRDGFVTNALQGEQTDGRDLWSGRMTLGFEPTENLRAWLTYEHFEEDDDRLRSGKQLCTRHDFPEALQHLIPPSGGGGAFGIKTYMSQGCQMGSLYDAEAFQVPNGFALPFYGPLANLGLPLFPGVDPYASTAQSRDLRVIETHIDPIYEAKSDILHLSVEYDLTDGLTLSSETAYGTDEIFSFNDYNRFNTSPNVFDPSQNPLQYLASGALDQNGVFCDPQLGCSNRLVAADLSTARSDQFSQEFRLSSDFDGPFNFHLGANYLRYATTNKYYVFINTLTLFGVGWCGHSASKPWDPGDTSDRCIKTRAPVDANNPLIAHDFSAIYIDRNPIGSLDDNGRNYFLSKNPFRLVSYAIFGEMQYEVTPDLKVTAGLRYTVDEKDAPNIPSWLLASQTYGLPTKEIVSQEWREPTGRLVIDWQPQTAFTDETLVYASYAHGYKAGGANPPLPGALPFSPGGQDLDFINATQPRTFDAEFVDAFELGSKNTLLDGRVTANLAAFYYDYQGYQISQIANRSAVNWNIDAEVWGAELEVDWQVFENLRLGFRGGYQKTKVGEGQSLIDMIDRTAGDSNYWVKKPWPTVPSNCIVPLDFTLDWGVGGANFLFDCDMYYRPDIDPLTRLPYVPNPTEMEGDNNGPNVPLEPELAGYPGFRPGDVPGGGAGIAKDLGGNELPNAPDTTMTFTVDYTIPLANDWLLTLHGDYYRQSQAWTRIFNEDPYDKLKPFSTINLAAILTNEDAGWNIMAYVKNLEDKDSITGAFLNSDDSGLTTNVFLNEPRLYGVRVTKAWTGGGWFGGEERPRRAGDRPFEISAGITRAIFDAENETFRPFWVGEFDSPNLPFPMGVQDDDLDAGDARDLRLTYRAQGTPWVISGAYRFGKTNGSGLETKTLDAPTIRTFPDALLPQLPPGSGEKYITPRFPEFTSSRAEGREEYAVVEFTVGRDFGFGALEGGRFNIAFGLRYAKFESDTEVVMSGQPHLIYPEYAFELPAGPNTFSTRDVEAAFRAGRTFEGTGPIAIWSAEVGLAGNHESGRLLLDWSLEGGVLFGEKATDVEREAGSRDYTWPAYPGTQSQSTNRGNAPPTNVISDAASFTRTDDVTVPLAGISLGLSYKIDQVKVSTGYRYETYFDAIDGGIDEARSEDRTIHGPYLRFTYGFGG